MLRIIRCKLIHIHFTISAIVSHYPGTSEWLIQIGLCLPEDIDSSGQTVRSHFYCAQPAFNRERTLMRYTNGLRLRSGICYGQTRLLPSAISRQCNFQSLGRWQGHGRWLSSWFEPVHVLILFTLFHVLRIMVFMGRGGTINGMALYSIARNYTGLYRCIRNAVSTNKTLTTRNFFGAL